MELNRMGDETLALRDIQKAGREFYLPQNIMEEFSPEKDDVEDDKDEAAKEEFDEERLTVDRHIIQQMLATDEERETMEKERKEVPRADEFFKQVMKETGAKIEWPENVKSEAKSKKHPWVKLIGAEESRRKAKEAILAILRPRNAKITLKMDVAFTDHSFIIGRSGRNTQKLMMETNTHVHFPDSNKYAGVEKSNQVSVTGHPVSVEEARHRIRLLAPIPVSIHLEGVQANVNLPQILNHPSILQSKGCNVSLLQDHMSGNTLIYVRGSCEHRQEIIQTVQGLISILFFNPSHAICSTTLEVLPNEQESILPIHLHLISQRCGALIRPPGMDLSRPSSFIIQGEVNSILSARDHLIGFLPLHLSFQVDENLIADAVDLRELELSHHSQISIQVNKAKSLKTCVISTTEANVSAAYALRREVLKEEGKDELHCDDYAFMADLIGISTQVVWDPFQAAARFVHIPLESLFTTPSFDPSQLQIQPSICSPTPFNPVPFKSHNPIPFIPKPFDSPPFNSYEEAQAAALKAMASSPGGIRYPTPTFAGLGFSKTLNDAALRSAKEAPKTNFPLSSIEEATQKLSLGQGTSRMPRFSETAYGFHRMRLEEINAVYSQTHMLGDILRQMNLGHYALLFAAEEIVDLDAFLALDDADLRQIGLHSHSARQKISALQHLLRPLHYSKTH